MNIDHIHKARSEAVEEQLQSLQTSIQNLTSRLVKRKEVDKSNSTSQCNSLDWTNVYKKWDEFEDIEEIKMEIQKSKQKFGKLKKNYDMTQRKKDKNKTSFCCSSSNRNDERRVVMMTTKERLEYMQSFRCDHGNVEYEKGCFASARKWYDKALIYYEYCFMSSGTEAKQVEHERLLCLLNMAACDIAMKNYNDCIETCCEALEVAKDKNHETVKALFRRAKAYRLTHNFQNARDDLDQAKDIILTSKMMNLSKDIDTEQHLLTQDIQKYTTNSKVFAKQMLRAKSM